MLPLVCDACPDVTWLRGGRWGASPAMSDTLLTGERRVLELVATGAPLSAVLDAICALLEHPPRVLASIYLLACTVTMPLYGRLADAFGRKRIILGAIVLGRKELD